jgi:hypothetical protein
MPTRLISRYRVDAVEGNPKPNKDRDVLPENLVEICEECRNLTEIHGGSRRLESDKRCSVIRRRLLEITSHEPKP